jgi:hypothetical protein
MNDQSTNRRAFFMLYPDQAVQLTCKVLLHKASGVDHVPLEGHHANKQFPHQEEITSKKQRLSDASEDKAPHFRLTALLTRFGWPGCQLDISRNKDPPSVSYPVKRKG